MFHEHFDDPQGTVRTGLPRPGGPHPSARSGHGPLPQGADGRNPRLRRRIQRGGQPGRLLRAPRPASPPPWSATASASWWKPESARRASRPSTSGSRTTASAAPISPPSIAIAAKGSARPWSSTTAPMRRPPCSSPATSTGPAFSPAACAGSIAAASSPRFPRAPRHWPWRRFGPRGPPAA